MPEDVLHGPDIGLVSQDLVGSLPPAAGVLLELVPVFVGLAHAAPAAGDSGVPLVILQVYMSLFEQMLQEGSHPGEGHVRAVEAGVLQPLLLLFLCHGTV